MNSFEDKVTLGKAAIGVVAGVVDDSSELYTELLSNKDIIDQLKARVMELEEAGKACVLASLSKGINAHSWNPLVEALSQTPTQSLEAHDREVAAKALEDAASHAPADIKRTWLIDRAARIRTTEEFRNE